jgi:hypothetical protein
MMAAAKTMLRERKHKSAGMLEQFEFIVEL